MADDKTGRRSSGCCKRLEKDGFEIGGEQLKTAPRGYDATTRGSTCCAASSSSSAGLRLRGRCHRAGLVDRVRADWEALRPLVSWLTAVEVEPV